MSTLIKLLEDQVVESDATGTDVGKQRERNHRYYSMQPFGDERKGYSHYIAPSVFGSVEDKKAVYSESFLSSRQVVRFNGENRDESEAKSAYAQRALKANKYERLFADGWHNAFVAKSMTMWVDWRRDTEEVELTLMGHPSPVVNQMLSSLGQVVDVNTDELESYPTIAATGQQQLVHSGKIVVTIDASYIDIDLIQPEFVLRDPEQAYADDSAWNTARMDITKNELVNMGFDPDQVDNLQSDYRWGSSEEARARKAHDNSGDSKAQSRDGGNAEVTVFKTRSWLTPDQVADIGEGFEPESGPAIYEIYWGLGEILSWSDGTPAVKVLDEMAVFEWTEFKISHAASGMCTADVEAHQQKAGSKLKRGVMDNMSITNNPRYEANATGLRDIDDLYDNAIGGVIETEDGFPVGQVKALDQPQLSPVVFGVMQMLDSDSEQRSGQSQASRGLNADVLSQQNAESMVDKVTTRGERRVGMGVRSFANTFLVPMLQCIVRFGQKYDKSQEVMEAGGRKVMIAPGQWQDEEHEMEIEVALTPSEASDMAQKLLQMNGLISQDEDMKALYTIKHKHALFDTVYELLGVKDSTKFLGSPESPEYKNYSKAMGQKAQEQEMIQKQVMGTQLKLATSADKREWDKFNWTRTNDMSDNLREDDKLAWDKSKGQQELDIERTQKRAASIG